MPTVITTLDCKGVRGGSAVIDRCGVCGGDGKSCLGCSDVSIFETQLGLDGTSLDQKNLVFKISGKLAQAGKDAQSRSFVDSVRREAESLYKSNWNFTWGMPRVVSSCSNTTFCVQKSNAAGLTAYNDNATRLRNLALQALKRLDKTSKDNKRKARNRLFKKQILQYYQSNLEISATVPVTVSSCS